MKVFDGVQIKASQASSDNKSATVATEPPHFSFLYSDF